MRIAAAAWWPYVCVALVGVTHRLLLFWAYRPALVSLAEANPDRVTMQLLPLAMLRGNATGALIYLQQTPPLPNLLMAMVAKWCPEPAALVAALVCFQALLTCATALVLTHIILTLFPGRRLVAAAIGALFVLDTNLVVLEYDMLGQLFYENLSMLLAVASLGLLIEYRRAGRRRTLIELGVAVALLALTRASWSYVAAPIAIMVALMACTRRARAVAIFLIPVLCLHGGWSLKNWIVFGNLSAATSTWAGWNLFKGITTAGFATQFEEFVRARADQLSCSMGRVVYPPPADADAEIQTRVGFAQPTWNTVAFRLAAEKCQRAVMSFCAEFSALCMQKVWRAYELFWMPIGYHGYMNLFALGKGLKRSFDVVEAARLIATGVLPDRPYVLSGTAPEFHRAPATLYTPRWIDPLTRVINLIAVHLLAPLLLVAGLWRPARTPAEAQRRAALLIALTLYAYLAIVSSVAEYGENMRFRAGVEPLIWLISVLSFGELFGRLWSWRRPAQVFTTAATAEAAMLQSRIHHRGHGGSQRETTLTLATR